MSAETDQEIPNIIHDKVRKEYRLTLPNLAHQDKVRLIAVSIEIQINEIDRYQKLAYAAL